MSEPTDDTDLLIAPEVSELTRVPVGTLAQWRSNKVGPKWFRMGSRRVVYRKAEVLAWIKEQEEAS